MERNNIDLTNSFKEQSIYGRAKAIKDSPWSFGDHHNHHLDHHEDYLLGFSWPPRSYTCSFCKREFRSAQALGGHMNVHRRDRARLRLQSSSSSSSTPSPPPSCLLNPKPNPNPNLSPSSVASSPPPLTLFPTLSSVSPMSRVFSCHSLSSKANHRTGKAMNTVKPVAAEEVKRFGNNDICKFLKTGEIISSEQDLDLELRLGFA